MGIKLHHQSIYYYRSVREGARVRSEYVAGGVNGVLAYRLDQARREELRDKARLWRESFERDGAALAALDEVSGAVDVALASALVAAGYHKCGRHFWRRKRLVKTRPDPEAMKAIRELPPEEREARRAEVDGMSKWAAAGKLSPETKARLRDLMLRDDFPSIAGGPGECLKARLAALYGGTNDADITYFEVWFDKMFAEVAGENAGALERMLAFRVVCSWGVLHVYEARTVAASDVMTIQQSECQQRRINSASRRFLAAAKALADVRRLPASVLSIVNVHHTENTTQAAAARQDAPALKMTPPPGLASGA